MLAVTTYFWRDPSRVDRGYTFNHQHVRVLQSMVKRNLSIPHRFICVTDEKIEGVECVPLDWRKHVSGTVLLRLMQHRPDITDLFGSDITRIMNLDLDVVITGSLDEIVSREGDAVFFRNPNFPSPHRSFYQGSIQLFTPGARACLWDDFDPEVTPRWMNWRFGGREQAWISERLDWDEATFTEADGVYGAGRLGGEGIHAELPENACLVSFPGAREPSQPEVQARMPWIADHYHV